MRASLVTEHKLVLQEFVATPAGRVLVDAGARALDVAPAALDRTIASLPRLDFYVPSRDHRRTWNGGGQLSVAAVLGPDRSTVQAFTPAGERTELSLRGPSRGTVLFLLHEAESKSLRIGAQASGPGSVIQDAGDGELSGTLIRYLPGGVVEELPLARLDGPPGVRNTAPGSGGVSARVECGSSCGGAGGGGTTTMPADTTLLKDVVILGVCDNGFCQEGNEFEWRTHFQVNGATVERRDLRIEGISSTYENYVNRVLMFRRPKYSTERIAIDVVETDGISGDDRFTPSIIFGTDLVRTTWYNRGAGRCTYDWRFSCFAQNVDWRETNHRFSYSAR
jgi:hypothetical protein